MKRCYFCTGTLKDKHTKELSITGNKTIYLHSNYCYTKYKVYQTTANSLRIRGLLK